MITTKTKELSYVEQGKDLIVKVKSDITIKDYANYFTDILNPTEEELTIFSLDCGEDVDKIKKLLLQHKSLPDFNKKFKSKMPPCVRCKHHISDWGYYECEKYRTKDYSEVTGKFIKHSRPSCNDARRQCEKEKGFSPSVKHKIISWFKGE